MWFEFVQRLNSILNTSQLNGVLNLLSSPDRLFLLVWTKIGLLGEFRCRRGVTLGREVVQDQRIDVSGGDKVSIRMTCTNNPRLHPRKLAMGNISESQKFVVLRMRNYLGEIPI